ncbi:hypothetical protein HWC53_gp044 [Bacillus phage vB_BmeM-Goe8]|uniref:Uncharacterized protein n=1 Tax=Bacillus phage vB_BmeM-Goe8 TaxID=2593638 RepID=A0A516KMK7_9CAUD|nr:hypothetical protein HWC53_gp044 [Bacillus phage vB_BmeM-Goe8]QDP42828.1 hypothetical protein Goe8_c00440 [Bacillus phage vB_BmeM-Goe8]
MAVRSAKKEVKLYKQTIENVVNELKDIIIEEEVNKMNMDKGNNKNRLDHEFTTRVTQPLTERFFVEEEKGLTLTDLITRKATDEDYAEIVDMLAHLARKTFKDYNFLIARSSDETKDTHFLQVVSHSSEEPGLHKKIFRKAIDCGAEYEVLVEKFAASVAKGEVIDLGEDVIVIVDDNTGNPPTGVSPINSGIEGGEIAFIISFIKKENYDEWAKNTFPEEEEAAE